MCGPQILRRAVRYPLLEVVYRVDISPHVATISRKMASSRLTAGPRPNDESIAVIVGSDPFSPRWTVQRSVLTRSLTFAAFFVSQHYFPTANYVLYIRDEESYVVGVALRYLAELTHFVPPSMAELSTGAQVHNIISLYFVAKRLQLPDLEDIAYSMLKQHEGDMRGEVIADLASVIYKKPAMEADCRVRGFLQCQVQQNLRGLLNCNEWRSVMRTASPELAADLFEFISTILLEGEADQGYPPKLAPAGRNMPMPEHDDETICAVVCRKFPPIGNDDQACRRGERLAPCSVYDHEVLGMDSEGRYRLVPRDYVQLDIERKPQVTNDEVKPRRTLLGRKHTPKGDSIADGSRRKAFWSLGKDRAPNTSSSAPLLSLSGSTGVGSPETPLAPSTSGWSSTIKRRLNLGGTKDRVQNRRSMMI